jgi:hypothetical protein
VKEGRMTKICALLAVALSGAADPKGELSSAARKLSEQAGDAWTWTPKGDDGHRRDTALQSVPGRIEKDGYTSLSLVLGTVPGNTLQKGDMMNRLRRSGDTGSLGQQVDYRFEVNVSVAVGAVKVPVSDKAREKLEWGAFLRRLRPAVFREQHRPPA